MSKIIKLQDFKPDDKNFNKHSKEGMDLLGKSVDKVGIIESITVSSDDKVISGNARRKVISKKYSEADAIIVETDGTKPVILKRTDIKSGTKQFHEAAILANTVAKKNINLDHEKIEEVAVNEFDIDIEELGVENLEDEDQVKGSSSNQEEEEIEDGQEGIDDNEDFFQSMLDDVIYESNNEYEIPNLLLDKQAGKLMLPFAAWGADSRLRTDVATYCFYVDDYRFEAIWKDPVKVLTSGVKALVEPNLSLFDTTPVAFGLQQIYKKRWISRYFQECGILIYADLNVSKKFYEYNQMGIPKGYNAFFTRGYSDRLEYLKEEHQIAIKISGKKVPNLLVYGGGAKIKEYCVENSLVYVEQFMQSK